MPGRLYLKIFLSFLVVIVLAMFMVAMLFRFTEGDRFVGRFKQFARAQVVMIRTVVEGYSRTHPGATEPLQELVDQLGEAYKAKVWITDDAGSILVRSFPGPPPAGDEIAEIDGAQFSRKWEQMDGATFVKCGEDPKCVYVTIPYGGEAAIASGVIHCLYRSPVVSRHEEIFLFGLLGICVCVALLVMPISWFITRRLNGLRRVALRIADGDLSHRADVCGKDEVANVGRALNHMADSLSRMIRGSRELTANVSHELRTPLTRIRIAEEMLRRRFGDEGVAHLDSISEDVDALDHLIGRLLEFSKLDLKEIPFIMEEIEISELMEAIATRLSPIAGHRGVSMDVDLPPAVQIEGHGVTLNVALGNLFENGVKHATENGWLKISATLNPSSLVVTTENSHAPLSDEELTSIFEPFQRARGTTPKGNGLGLAIAKKIIERHNGTIYACNIPDGVRFVVELPLSGQVSGTAADCF